MRTSIPKGLRQKAIKYGFGIKMMHSLGSREINYQILTKSGRHLAYFSKAGAAESWILRNKKLGNP